MHDGPAAGLPLIDAILARGNLKNYHLARAAYERALGLATGARAALHQTPTRRTGLLRRRGYGYSACTRYCSV